MEGAALPQRNRCVDPGDASNMEGAALRQRKTEQHVPCVSCAMCSESTAVSSTRGGVRVVGSWSLHPEAVTRTTSGYGSCPEAACELCRGFMTREPCVLRVRPRRIACAAKKPSHIVPTPLHVHTAGCPWARDPRSALTTTPSIAARRAGAVRAAVPTQEFLPMTLVVSGARLAEVEVAEVGVECAPRSARQGVLWRGCAGCDINTRFLTRPERDRGGQAETRPRARSNQISRRKHATTPLSVTVRSCNGPLGRQLPTRRLGVRSSGTV